MPHRMLFRRTCLVAAACLVAGPTAVAASAEPAHTTGRMTLVDIAGDANGLNDQGEGLIGNRAVGRQVAQADLRSVDLVPLSSESTASGLRVQVTTTSAPAPLEDGTPLAYGLVMQPHPDCRIVLEYVSEGVSRTGAALAERGRLIHSCEDGRYQEVPLPGSVSGRTLTVDVPYDVLPAQAQADAVAHSVAAYVRTAPFGELNRAKPGELDGVRTGKRYTFPG